MIRKALGALVAVAALALTGLPAGADVRSYAHTHCNSYTVRLDTTTTSTCLPHQYARSSGIQTKIVVLTPPRTSDYWFEYYVDKSVRDFNGRADFWVVRRYTNTWSDPGYNYNVVVVTRGTVNGGWAVDVWDFADPHRDRDLAAGIKRRTLVRLDNSRRWDQANAAFVIPHEIKGHAIGSLDHPPAGYTFGPGTAGGNLTAWDRYLVGLQNRWPVAGAPAGAT